MNAQSSGKRPWTAVARGEGVRDLHPHDTRAPVAGHHRSARCDGSTTSGRRSPPTGRRARATSSRTPRGDAIAAGENLEVDPPRRLVQSFTALWSEEVKSEGTSRVTWEIEPVGDSCRLTVTHDQLGADAHGELYGGWPMILSGLKTLLETGETLTTPGSLRYSRGPRLGLEAVRPAVEERHLAHVVLAEHLHQQPRQPEPEATVRGCAEAEEVEVVLDRGNVDVLVLGLRRAAARSGARAGRRSSARCPARADRSSW